MTSGSNHQCLISPSDIQRTCRLGLLLRLKSKSEKSWNMGTRPMDKKQVSSCPVIQHKQWTRMEPRESNADYLAEDTAEGLKDLALKWFLETQIPLILNNGFFPTWFQGVFSRRNAEELLQGKEQGCFLVRLSEKAIGYILSYKGKDRCRHFVINQVKSGQFVVSGDIKLHDTPSELIEYYKKTPIEPFGEYLTSSCFENSTEELYDSIQISNNSTRQLCLRAVGQHVSSTSEELLMSEDSGTPEERPPLLKCVSLDHDSSINEKTLYAPINKNRTNEIPKCGHSCQETGSQEKAQAHHLTYLREDMRKCNPDVDSTYSELSLSLLDAKSRSLPFLDNNSDETRSYKLSAFSLTQPTASTRSQREAPCYALPLEQTDSRASSSPSLDFLCNRDMYHIAGRPGSALCAGETSAFTLDSDSIYAEIIGEATGSRPLPDNQMARHGTCCTGDGAKLEAHNDTFVSLEDLKPKHTLSSMWIKMHKVKLFKIKRK